MIAEALIMGGSSIFIWSLWLGGALGKRKGSTTNSNGSKVHPFVGIFIGTLCPICGVPATKNHGLQLPKACTKKQFPDCKTKEAHLHVECTFCTAKFLMAPAYSEKIK